MKKIKFGDFGDLKGAEIIDTVIGGGGNFRLERILSKSSASADGFWYDQPECEFALVLDGFAETIPVRPYLAGAGPHAP